MKALLHRITAIAAADERVDRAVLLVLGLGILVPMLWAGGLWDPCETHALEVAREAAEDGRWLPLAYDGKTVEGLPPLFFWVHGIWLKIAGTGDLRARLPMALMGLLWLLFTHRCARSLIGRKAAFLFSAAILTSPFFFGNARHASPHLLAAMLAFSAVISAAAALLKKKDPSRLEALLPWIFASAALLAGGLSALLAILLPAAAALIAGSLGALALPRLGRLRSTAGLLVFFIPAALWIGAGSAAGGASFLRGAVDLQVLSFGAMRAFCSRGLFTYPVVQAGHMIYPWAALLPAAAFWLAALAPRERIGDGEKGLIAVMLGGSVLLLCVNTFLPCHLPLDMLAACPSILFIGAWGLVFAAEGEGLAENRFLLPLGALLIALGFGSMGVDFFWALKRPIEVIGYEFDRPYPDLGAFAKVFYNTVAIASGASTAALLIWRKKAMLIYWTVLAASVVSALFIIHHVYRVGGESLGARQLIDAYGKDAREGDRIATYLMDPQARGGEVYYFKGKAEHLESPGDLLDAMKESAGKGRLILITSHVRDLYNQVFAASCGTRVKPLNEQRRWYAVCVYEGPPPTDPGGAVFDSPDQAGLQVPLETKLLWQGKHAFTFLGYSAGNIDTQHRTVRRGGWVDLSLFWRAEVKTDESWKVYLDAAALGKGKVSGNVSLHHVPACGTLPTYAWEPGSVIRDDAKLFFPTDLDAGTYVVRTGLYGRKGERMTVEAPGSTPGVTKTTITLLTLTLQ
jgi:4-amino-4-deoxy-L-arabinose transferase-like glycosyltransferase